MYLIERHLSQHALSSIPWMDRAHLPTQKCKNISYTYCHPYLFLTPPSPPLVTFPSFPNLYNYYVTLTTTIDLHYIGEHDIMLKDQVRLAPVPEVAITTAVAFSNCCSHQSTGIGCQQVFIHNATIADLWHKGLSKDLQRLPVVFRQSSNDWCYSRHIYKWELKDWGLGWQQTEGSPESSISGQIWKRCK